MLARLSPNKKVQVGQDDRGYWQTVMVCQLKVIGRLYGLPIRDYWQTVDKICKRLPKSYCWQTPGALYKRETITALFKRLRQRASACHLQPVTFPLVPGG